MKSDNYVVLSGICCVAFLGALPNAAIAQSSWTDSIAVSGDIRPRFEAIDEDGETGRERGRFRARLKLEADVNENVKAVIRLATGGGNPVSTNQSFDGGFSRKDIGVDQAYVDWTPRDDMHVLVGKIKNPFVRAGGHALVWDSDLNPEGVAVTYEAGMFFGTAATLFVEERSSSDDSILLALQGGVEFDLGGDGTLTTGLSYYDYSDTEGNAPFYDGNARGNTVDANGNLVFDYNQVEWFAEWSFTAGEQPMTVFADFVQNSDADSFDSGYAFGVKYGKASEPGTWEASWAWQDLEADAVIATFTDSDFGGGGTDASGHVLKAEYAIADNWAFAATLFINEIDAAVGNAHDYSRLQLDLEFSF